MSNRPCPISGELVEVEIDRIATQYRESPKLLGFIRSVLGQAEEIARATCAIPSFFDLDTAVGDQLTLLGKRLGWPRCHCVCDAEVVFGFVCASGTPNPVPIGGFCESTSWINCRDVGTSEICLSDDGVYRGYLKARRYQALSLYDLTSLEVALRHMWGLQATVLSSGFGRVVIAPNRVLTASEMVQLPLVVRVLPIAPGIRATVHFGTASIFGFGTGWDGFCKSAVWMCPADPHAYRCAA